MKIQKTLALLALFMVPAVLAAGGPDRLNYQGVLRDADGNPRQGTFDMRFRLFDAATVGQEMLVDEHLAAGTGGVVVTGGLFNVPLGSGQVSDGSGPGVYGSIGAVVGQLDDVWLEIEVAGETLSPRVRVLSSAFAMNARLLQGKDASQFLDTSAATQVKTGLLVANGGVDFGPGTSDDLSSADVTALTGGGNADALHTHSLVAAASNASLLDSIDSSQFLRSDTNDQYTSGTLTFSPGTVLSLKGDTRLDGRLFLDYDGPDATQAIHFYDGGDPMGEAFAWNESLDRFTLSNTLRLENNATLQQTGDSLYMNSAGPDRPQSIYFYDLGEPTGQSIAWDDANSQFWLSAKATVAGMLTVDQNLRVNGSQVSVRFSGPDQDQTLGFFDDGAAANEYLKWSNVQDLFVLSNDLGVNGVLRTGFSVPANGNYSAIGGGTSTSTDVTTPNDLLVTEDLEVGDQIYLGPSQSLQYGPGVNFYFNRGLHVGDAVGENLEIGGNSLYFSVGAPGGNLDFYLNYSLNRFNLSDDLDVDGTLTANSKNFVQNHPFDKSLEVVYTTLEGPEAATFTRGSARLQKGTARIPLEGSFAWVTSPGLGLTVSLTPRKEWANLYVVSVTTSELVVAASPDSAPDAAFDYLVMGMRIGYEEQPVVRPKTREASLPTPENLRAPLAGRADLIAHTPLARFRETAASVFGEREIDLTQRDALRAAVGMDPKVGSPSGPKELGPEQPSATVPHVTATQPAGVPAKEQAPVTAAASREEHGNPHARLDSVSPVIGSVEPGDVLADDPSGMGVRRADLAGDVGVVGIATGRPVAQADGTTTVAFASAGVVTCNVDTTNGPVQRGDLLVASPIPGYAMRADAPAPGSVLGKALEVLPDGTGAIRVLVVLR